MKKKQRRLKELYIEPRLLALAFRYSEGHLYFANSNEIAEVVGLNGYLYVEWECKEHTVQNIVWFMHSRKIPPRMVIDHADGDILNNDISNLRLATFQENRWNTAAHCDGNSKYKGVHFRKKAMKWCAQISVDGKTKYLGEFESEEAAAMAYEYAAKEVQGEFFRKFSSRLCV